MKITILIIISAAVISTKTNTIPSKDNFNLLNILANDDDENRYAWMSDDGGVPHYVDLAEPVDTEFLKARIGTDNEYWLFTRKNPRIPQRIITGDINTVWNSNYEVKQPLVVISHGWTGSLYSLVNTRITAAYLAVDDVNVIVVDWRDVADTNYVTAATGAPIVGQHTGHFVNWLVDNAVSEWDNVHFVGFSLGAHALGEAGRTVNGMVRRITGLDPAGPLWNVLLATFSLSPSDGQYVEAIHTNSGFMGKLFPVADADFYPNGGIQQPGCANNQCSHSRSYDLYAASIYMNHFVGRRCTSLTQALANVCSGADLKMGNGILNKNGTGIYSLSTGRTWPF